MQKLDHIYNSNNIIINNRYYYIKKLEKFSINDLK